MTEPRTCCPWKEAGPLCCEGRGEVLALFHIFVSLLYWSQKGDIQVAVKFSGLERTTVSFPRLLSPRLCAESGLTEPLLMYVWQASTRKAHFEYSTAKFCQACQAHLDECLLVRFRLNSAKNTISRSVNLLIRSWQTLFVPSH